MSYLNGRLQNRGLMSNDMALCFLFHDQKELKQCSKSYAKGMGDLASLTVIGQGSYIVRLFK